MPEIKILDNILDYMEETGSISKVVSIDIDQDLVDQINQKNKTSYQLSVIQEAADKCIAREWLRHETLDQYSFLQITDEGLRIIRAKRNELSLKASKGIFKKLSDGVDEYPGLIAITSLLVSILALIISFLSKR